MKPTNKLRFVEREIQFDVDVESRTCFTKKVRVLQQWWTDELDPYFESLDRGEWRDVPLEVESE